MADKKEKPAHEKTLEHISSKHKAMESYAWALKHEHESMLSKTRSHFIDKLGSDKAYEHLKTNKGQLEFGDVGAKTIEDMALKRYGIKKDKVHEFDLTRLVESTYGVNKDILSNFVKQIGPEFDFAHYKSNFLDDHLKQVKSSIMQNHVMDYTTDHIPAVLKHIGADKYFKDVNILKNDKYKGSVAQAVANWDGGKNPIGESYIKQDPNLAILLHDKYK
ncbi:MAG: hypothetical protein ACOC2U_03075 [bacterium]